MRSSSEPHISRNFNMRTYNLPFVRSLYAIPSPLGGCDSLMDKVTDSWLTCHEFEPGTVEDSPFRGGRSTLNMWRLKRSPVGMVWKLGENVSSSSGILVTWPWFKITRTVAKSPLIAE
ncbi:hypothetical protein TNCV_2377281 [Trichonephila clavipes]|nr:hypothetical protein TNCV_2377281 [Trichonephila clavipes]